MRAGIGGFLYEKNKDCCFINEKTAHYTAALIRSLVRTFSIIKTVQQRIHKPIKNQQRKQTTGFVKDGADYESLYAICTLIILCKSKSKKYSLFSEQLDKQKTSNKQSNNQTNNQTTTYTNKSN